MRRLLLAGAIALLLSGCAQDGSVDWGAVGTVAGAVIEGAAIVAGGVAEGYAAAQPAYVPPTEVIVVCHSAWGC